MITSDYVAWYGAAIGTLVLFWDIYKWKMEGPRLSGKANANMELFDTVSRQQDAGKFLIVEIVNRGTATTTLTSFCLFHHPNQIYRILGLKKRSYFIPTPTGSSLPFELTQGGRWTGGAKHNPELSQLLSKGVLFAAVHHTLSNKPYKIRVRN